MSQFKKKLSAFTAMIAFLSLTGASAMANNYFVGQMDGKTNNMNLTQSGNRLDIENLGGKGAVGQVDWKSFNVGKGQHVNFGFNGLSQTIINRVLGGQQSNILGKLTSSCAGGGNCSSYNESGKVLFINPAGVLFGNGSMVDINSFTASTFDVKGAKNLSSLSKEALDKYQIDILNKMSPIASVRNDGTTGGTGYITLDSNYTQAFKEAGIKINDAAAITANGATFAKLNADGTISDGLNTNKTVAFVANNINYKDSLIRTGDLYNSKTGSSQYSMGNVKLITADGVTFGYNNQGYSNSTKSVAEDTKTNVTRNINIDNSGLGEKELAINSGEIQIINKTNAKNSNVKISNTLMKANKLINTTSGDIIIQSTHDIDIDNSRIHTANSKEINGTNNTEAQKGGKVTIKSTGDGNVNIDDSLILTASGTGATASANNAGGALIASNGGNVNMSNTEVVAQGNTEIQAGKQVKLNNSFVYAKNLKDTANAKNIKITAGEKVNIHNSGLHAQKDIDIATVTSDNKLTGEVIISSDLDSKGKSQTLIVANNNLSIQGANTKLDNAAVVYDTITV